MVSVKRVALWAAVPFALLAGSASAEVPVETLVQATSALETGPMGPEKACLAEAVFKEAGAEPAEGRLAVAHVILNRTRSGAFPRTVCGVVNQKGQFTYRKGGRIAKGAERQWAEARAIASMALAGRVSRRVSDALFFRSVRMPRVPSLRFVTRIGGHAFYASR